MCVFPDGSRVASAGAEEAVTVWDLTFRSGRPAPKPSELLAAANDLADPKASVGYPAVKLLAAAGNAGAAQLAAALKETIANEKKIKEWVADPRLGNVQRSRGRVARARGAGGAPCRHCRAQRTPTTPKFATAPAK